MANPVVSGTASFLVTRDDIIKAALRSLRVLSIGQTPATEDVTNCAFALNLILKNLALEGYMKWLYKVIVFPFVATKASYSIAEVGADITDFRPVRIAQGWRRDTTTTPNIDIPLIGPISMADYNLLTPKGQPGVPNSFFYDAQIGLGATITYWPVPQDTTNSGVIAIQRPVMDILSSSQNFDVTQDWFLALRWMLAAEVASEYEVDLKTISYIEQKAMMAKQKVADFAQEDAPSRFMPDTQSDYRGNRFD